MPGNLELVTKRFYESCARPDQQHSRRSCPREVSGRGFHHHATLCFAAYGFLISERATIPPSANHSSKTVPEYAKVRYAVHVEGNPEGRASHTRLYVGQTDNLQGQPFNHGREQSHYVTLLSPDRLPQRRAPHRRQARRRSNRLFDAR
jgi:hypothetical protein